MKKTFCIYAHHDLRHVAGVGYLIQGRPCATGALDRRPPLALATQDPMKERQAIVQYQPPQLPRGSEQDAEHKALVRSIEINRAVLDPLFLWPLVAAFVQLIGALG